MKSAQKALHETNKRVIDIGGIPWKAEIPAQKEILRRMDKNTKELIFNIKKIIGYKWDNEPRKFRGVIYGHYRYYSQVF